MPFNSNIYNINFKKLVVWLLHKPIRKPVQVSWLMALLSPLTWLHNQFLAFRTSVLYFLFITPQVCKLEQLLNDRYDTVQRRIIIRDGLEYDPVFIYRRAENKPVALYRRSEGKPVWLYTKGETGATAVDFIVEVPVFVVFDLNEMRGLIKRFKLASKTFKIQIV